MQVPAILYGSHRDVIARCRPLVRELKKGAAFEDLDFGPLGFTATGPMDLLAEAQKGPLQGLVCLEAPGFGVGTREVNWRLYPVADAASESLSDGAVEGLIRGALRQPWTTCMLMGQVGLLIRKSDERRRDFLRAVLGHWETIVEVGPRLSAGGVGEIWQIPSQLFVVLADLGIAGELLRQYPRNLDDLIRSVLPDS